jgi:hypothetical protein
MRPFPLGRLQAAHFVRWTSAVPYWVLSESRSHYRNCEERFPLAGEKTFTMSPKERLPSANPLIDVAVPVVLVSEDAPVADF